METEQVVLLEARRIWLRKDELEKHHHWQQDSSQKQKKRRTVHVNKSQKLDTQMLGVLECGKNERLGERTSSQLHIATCCL